MSRSVTSESDDGGLSTDSNPSNDCNNFEGRLNGEVVLKKGPWTSTEDAVLVEYVKKHGEGNWNAVQKHSGLSRCGKSCRLRWANHLRPNLKKGSFTLEEERLIIELHAKMGNKWSRIAAHLPGRTDNEIKNYWNTRIKRRHRAGLPLYPPELCPQALPHNQQTLNSCGTYAGDKSCYDIMQSDGNYKIPEVVFSGLNSLPYTAEFPDISASGSLISGFGCPQFYSFVPQTIGSQKHTQVPHEAMSDYGGGASNEAPSFDNAYTDNFEINRSQPFDPGFQYDPDHTEKQFHLGVKQDCHFMSNGFFSASKPFPGAEKFELPSLQYQDTNFGIWDTAPEFMDSFVQSSVPSPRSSDVLEALLYEARAENQCSDKATSSAISAVGIKDSSPLKTCFSGCNGYLDPASPSSNSVGTFFNECTPTHTVGISPEEKIPVCLLKSEAVDQRWIVDRETEDIFNQSECYSPDAILGSTGSLTCCTWIKMPGVSQVSDRH